MFSIRRYSLLLTVLLNCQLTLAQSKELYFENYTSQDGLSQNSCFAIAQDANGFMWFGTQDGLNRYDGKQFRIFLPQYTAGKKLPSNYISSLFFDSYKNILWVGTLLGACIFHPRKDSLLKISELFPYAALLENIPVKSINSFRENEYWIITYNKGLLQLNTRAGTIRSFFDDGNNREKVNSIALHQGRIITAVSQQLFYLSAADTGYRAVPLRLSRAFPEIKALYSWHDVLWIGTLAGGCFYTADTIDAGNTIHVHPFKAATDGIGCFAADAAGRLWIGTRGKGIMRFDAQTKSIQTAVHNRYDNRSPEKDFVLSLFRDRQGIMWCGLSGGGIAKYDPLKYQFATISNDPLNAASLPDNMVFTLYKSQDGHYYVGTQNKGLVAWDTATNQFHTYPAFSHFSAAGNTVYSITEDDRHNLWIASWDGLIQLNTASKKLAFYKAKHLLPTNKLYTVYKLQDADSLFIAGENGAVFFSLKDRQWKTCADNLLQVNAYAGRYCYEDAAHLLWICTEGGGLVTCNYHSGRFATVAAVKKHATYVRYLLKDGPLFWLATDNGIVVYDAKNDSVIKHILINTSDASDVCYAIQKDRNGFFWASTNNGLYKIDPHNYNVQNYDLGSGLSFLEYNTACTLAEPDGTLLFGGVGGITKFDPSLLKENGFSPAPQLTALQVNGVARSAEKALCLHHQENFITIQFAVNNFSNSHKNRFGYRLQGLNDNWVQTGNNTASYSGLPPGDYKFQLRSANSDGKWSSDMVTLHIRIYPPWWQSWWFRTGALLVIGGIVFMVVRKRIAGIRYEAVLQRKIAETEMMALRAQMNPHFIFNCINSIDALIHSNDKYAATIYLNKFAMLLRNILDSSRQNTVTLTKDLETLQLYIDLEQLRYENKFTAAINTDELLSQEDYKVPPLIVQPYVENAILHGLKNRPDNNGQLTITVSRNQEYIQYLIEDNGVGREALKNGFRQQNPSYGMQMSSDRVRFFNNETHASVVVTDLQQNGQAAGTKIQVLLKIQ
ncbi:two-component regulator propeller domain-containing protein [Chitinophaga sp. 212800010-3]|uniref:ligand-binding sensor domain-containing protein n=1 Tax=unclassified Chitinophaga TaxID=2619133 RepID=UPI002DEE498A|nr:His-kinase domain-containing protein [Chitinophaga sp. 212800010-3]